MPILVPDPPIPAGPVPVSPLGDLALAELPAAMRAADDGTLAALLAAVGAPVAWLTAMLQDPDETTGVWVTPAFRLAWRAAIAGVDLTGVPQDQWRAVIPDPAWRYRGGLDAVARRVGMTLTGAKQVEVVCPYLGDADRISVTTYASQTPDPTATTAAIRAEVPAWMRATIVTDAAGQSYANLAADYATYSGMTATSKTYGTLSQEI